MYKGSKSQVSGANKFTKNGLNGVPVARLGPIFSQDGATLTRKLFKSLPGPFPPVWDPKISKKRRTEVRRFGSILDVSRSALLCNVRIPWMQHHYTLARRVFDAVDLCYVWVFFFEVLMCLVGEN